jgi:hypothetical protein
MAIQNTPDEIFQGLGLGSNTPPQEKQNSGKKDFFHGDPQGRPPHLRRIVIIGHQLVKDDWNRFKPTKAVNHNQWALCQWARPRLTNMKKPAIPRKTRSMFMNSSYTFWMRKGSKGFAPGSTRKLFWQFDGRAAMMRVIVCVESPAGPQKKAPPPAVGGRRGLELFL